MVKVEGEIWVSVDQLNSVYIRVIREKNKTKNNSKDEKQKIETEENEKQNKKG